MIFTSIEGLKLFLVVSVATAANCIISFESLRLAYKADRKSLIENRYGWCSPDSTSSNSFFNNNREELTGTVQEMRYKK